MAKGRSQKKTRWYRCPKFEELLEQGRLKPGTELHHRALGRKMMIRAVVVPSGIEVDGEIFASPSAAGRATEGWNVNGWKYWRLPTGEPLKALCG
jgi:hypothetical protein